MTEGNEDAEILEAFKVRNHIIRTKHVIRCTSVPGVTEYNELPSLSKKIYKVMFLNYYHPRMRVGNGFGHICLSVCLSVSVSLCLSICLSVCLCVCLCFCLFKL